MPACPADRDVRLGSSGLLVKRPDAVARRPGSGIAGISKPRLAAIRLRLTRRQSCSSIEVARCFQEMTCITFLVPNPLLTLFRGRAYTPGPFRLDLIADHSAF